MQSPRKRRAAGWTGLLAAAVALSGCTSTREIRIQNVSHLDFIDVTVGGKPYGDIEAGSTSEYHEVLSKLGYVVTYLTAGGHRVNVQTLNFGGKRYTHRIGIKNLAAGHLDVELVRHKEEL